MAKSTNKAQYQKLYEMLSEKPDIAQGYTKTSKEDVSVFWETVRKELNILGPPSKEASTWRKVWLDWKAYIKRKLVEKKKEIKATGGGECKQIFFSKLEEGVIQLTGLHTSSAGIAGTLSFGCITCPEVQTQNSNENAKASDHSNLDVSMSSNRGELRKNLPSTSRKITPDTAKLLQQHIEVQNDFYLKTKEFYHEQNQIEKDLNKIGEKLTLNTKRIYRGVDKLCELKKVEIEETRRHNKVQEELLKKKIEIKLKMLKIEEANLDFHENKLGETN